MIKAEVTGIGAGIVADLQLIFNSICKDEAWT
jgi:hypothetical protein